MPDESKKDIARGYKAIPAPGRKIKTRSNLGEVFSGPSRAEAGKLTFKDMERIGKGIRARARAKAKAKGKKK